MPDSQGLSPGDTGYDGYSDPTSRFYDPSAGTPTWAGPPQSPRNGLGNGRPYDPNDPSTWITGTPVAPGTSSPVGQVTYLPGYQGPLEPGTNPSNPNPQTPTGQTPPAAGGNYSNVQDAFLAFVNANPAYHTGGQAAIDAFGRAYPQFSGVVSWSPQTSTYGLPNGYLTNLNGTGWSVTPRTPEGGNGAAALGAISGGGLLDPFPGMGPLPGAPPAPWQAPAPFAPFKPPTGEDVRAQDPSYEFDLNQGIGALTNAAAAKGVVRGGGTLQDILKLGTNFADQQFGNIYNRNLSTYNANLGTYNVNNLTSRNAYDAARQSYLDTYGIWNDNRNTSLHQLDTIYGIGANAAGSA